MLGFYQQGFQTIFLPEIQTDPHSLHVHQIADLLHPLVRHTAALADQFFIIFNADFASLAFCDQIIIFSALIRELDIKSKLFFYRSPKINLADVVAAGRHILKPDRLMCPIFNLIGDLRFRRLSDRPAIELNRIFTNPNYIDITFHAVCPQLFSPVYQNSAALPPLPADAS